MMNKRQSNIELLRIVAMLMIISYHYSIHGVVQTSWGGVTAYFNDGSLSHKVLVLLSFPGSSVGTYVFFVITGYFSIYKDNISLKKVFYEMSFYGILLFVLSLIVTVAKVNLAEGFALWNGVKGVIAPISSNMWWFSTSYVLLILLAPYINLLFNRLNRKGSTILLIIAFLISELHIIASTEYKLLVFPFFYYLMGGTIRKVTENKKRMIAVDLSVFTLGWILISTTYIPQYIPELSNAFLSDYISSNFCILTRNLILIPITCMFLFFTFLSLPNFFSGRVNYIASTTFGIYLFSDSRVMRQLLWNNILHVGEQYSSNYFILYAFISVVVVFATSSIVDILRIKIFEPLQYKVIESFKRSFTN